MIGYRFGLVALGGVAAATLAGLGLLTARQNVTGWYVVLFGLAHVVGGASYLAVIFSGHGSRPDTRHTALWLDE